ncbi:MAG: biotin/lipoyl-binding protein, partial [Acetobacteraceae bacterium]
MSARSLDGTAPVRLRPRSRRQRALAAAVLLLALAAAGLGWRWWTDWRFYETTDDAYVGGNVTAIAPHVSGFVATIAVQDNQYVRAGQVLVRLEGRDASAALAHAEAAEAAAAARAEAAAAALPLQRARLAADRAAVLGAAARLRFARQEAGRVTVLGVDEREPAPLVQSFIGRAGYAWTFLLDGQGMAGVAYGVQALPTSVFVD